jgi:hypothetical protein
MDENMSRFSFGCLGMGVYCLTVTWKQDCLASYLTKILPAR